MTNSRAERVAGAFCGRNPANDALSRSIAKAADTVEQRVRHAIVASDEMGTRAGPRPVLGTPNQPRGHWRADLLRP
jgi:hypothetical protein